MTKRLALAANRCVNSSRAAGSFFTWQTRSNGPSKTSANSAEHETRKDFGDVMTPREKVESVANEAGENVKAGVDKTKREIRDL